MPPSRFAADDLLKFLQLVDRELSRRCRIVLIGGGAVALAHHGRHTTMDLDLWEDPGKEFWAAVAWVRLERNVPVQKAAIAEPPYDFEDRLRPLRLRGLKKLEVFVPEPHDLVLMKTARGEPHDLDAIEDIHRDVGLRLETLIERFHETKDQVTGRPQLFKLKFLAVTARLFGEKIAQGVEAEL
jgi:hypothetical protein